MAASLFISSVIHFFLPVTRVLHPFPAQAKNPDGHLCERGTEKERVLSEHAQHEIAHSGAPGRDAPAPVSDS